MAPVSTVLVQFVMVEADEIFLAYFMHLLKLYPGAYDLSTLDPGPEQSVVLTSWDPESRKSNLRYVGGLHDALPI